MKHFLKNLKYRSVGAFQAAQVASSLRPARWMPRRHREIVNCGAPRSGSTLINAIVREVLKRAVDQEENFVFDIPAYLKKTRHPRPYQLIKLHNYNPIASSRVRRGQAIGFFTHRDIRDIVVSMKQKGWIDDLRTYFDNKGLHWVVYSSLLYAKTPGMHVFGYDDLTRDVASAVRCIAQALETSLGDEDVEQIVVATSVDKVKSAAQSVREQTGSNVAFDKVSGWHANHIADGRSGKWRTMLSPEEIAEINQIAAEFLAYFGYSAD